jgi:peptidylprolyl isomerase domain and WD repeat-containing protein 1
MAESGIKRKEKSSDSSDADDNSDGCIGPLPIEATKPKKKKVLAYEKVFLENLPSAESYERSYMHRDVISHVFVTKTDFIITTSCDGHLKFWKKKEDEGIEFVKHFRCHLGPITDLAVSFNGELASTVSDDKTVKVFDVVNFDMINMIKLTYIGRCCCWIYSPGDAIQAIAVAEKDANNIHIYDGRGSSDILHTFDKLHFSPVVMMRYNSAFETVVSVDTSGMLEYWTGPKHDYQFPQTVNWQYKTDTDLYDFAKAKTLPTGLAFSPNGQLMATLSKDRKVRVLRFATGKIVKVFDESLAHYSEMHQMKPQISNMEFGRRLATERDLEKSDMFSLCNIVFDQSGHFILYSTMFGIKVVNLETNRCPRLLGKGENARFLQIALFQGTANRPKAAVTLDMEASENPILKGIKFDPTLFCTALKKNRFYLFTSREPDDTKGGDNDRDVFNEKPSKEELISATQDTSYTRISDAAVIHTSMGDIHIQLFAKECPKTVENFCVHSRNGYYNGHIFHRVIKGFMIQTGDPLGNGTGGESIWGGEFEDEFHPSLRHDRPYTLSMANAGPNTNGSQFFITVAPAPWLDNKHTVFGRITKGIEVAQNISNAKTNSRTDKPHDDIVIVSITVK